MKAKQIKNSYVKQNFFLTLKNTIYNSWLIRELIVVFLGVFLALLVNNYYEFYKRKKIFYQKVDLVQIQARDYITMLEPNGPVKAMLDSKKNKSGDGLKGTIGEFLNENLVDFPKTSELILQDEEVLKFLKQTDYFSLSRLNHALKYYDMAIRNLNDTLKTEKSILFTIQQDFGFVVVLIVNLERIKNKKNLLDPVYAFENYKEVEMEWREIDEKLNNSMHDNLILTPR